MKTLFRFIISGLCIISIPISLSSQAYRKSVNPDNYGTNFIELSNHIDMFYDTAVGSNRSGYKQWKRWEWFAMHHLDENGQLGNYGVENIKAMEDMERLPDQNQRSAANGDWYNLGHSSVSGGEAKQGRINSIAFDPVNGSIVYVASAAGGIWKSTNNGISWTNLTIDLPILCFSDIIVAPAPNNNILYALSGDIAGSANVYRHSSIGVIKSYDSGATWTRTALTIPLLNQFSGFKLLMHPSNPSIILAAMADGIHRTTNGGDTWTNIMGLGTVNDMEFDLNNLDTVYFTLLNTNFFYRMSLTTLTTASTFIIPSVDRMEIAVTPDNPKAVYVLAGPGFVSNGMNLFNGLFYSGNSGSSFSLRSQSCSGNGDLFNSASSIAWYAITIVVDANEENNVIVGGLNLFRSTNGGVTLNQVTSNSIHSDQHNLKRNPLNGDLWLGNDGGLYRSTDNGITWNNKSNGLTINEYYRISGTNNSNDLMLGGTQDNGQFLMDAADNFQFVLSGDGMDNYFNSYDNTVAYACTQNGGLKRSINYGQAFYTTNLPNGGNGGFYPWIAPIVQHPPYYDPPFWHNTDVIYVYSLNGIMRSTDGTSWTNIGPSNIGQVTNSKCPSMAICSDAQGITNLYISNGNKFWACFNPLDDVPGWSLFALPINNTTYVSAIAVNPAVRSEVWVTISGYVGGTKVLRSQNGGLTWVNLSLSLPNTPIYSIVFANNSNNPSGAVYVGSEIGVFYTDDNLPDWVPFSNRLPHAPVTDLSMNYFTGELKAATYGRGVWETELYQTCPSVVLVDFDINQGQFSFESSNLIQADHFIQGGIGANVTMKAANQIKLKPGFKIFSGSYAHMKIGNCGEGVLTFTNENTPANAMEENNTSTEEEEKD